MARNGSGTYVAPTGNPVSSGTTITSSWANTTITDVGNEITNSLPRDGQAPMTATLKIIDGGSSTPGLAFNSESATGLFRPSAGNAALTVGGVEAFRANSGGRVLVGTTTDDGTTRLQVSGNQTVSGTLTITGSTTANNFHSSSAVVTGGSIDGTAIGATTASTGKFTTITATGTVTAPTFSGSLTGAASLSVLKAGDTMTGNLSVTSASTSSLISATATAGNTASLELAGAGNVVGSGGFLLRQDTASAALIFNRANAPMTFSTNSTTRMTIGASGLVGIGAAASTYPLEVNGDVLATNFRGALVGSASNNVLKAGDTMTGNLVISTGTSPTLNLNATAAGLGRYVSYTTAASSRWVVGVDSTAESGSNAGSNYFIQRYTDAGAFVDQPLQINRASGVVTLSTLSVGSTINASGTVTAPTFSGALSGNAATATKLATARTLAITGDLSYTSPSFDGSGNVTAAGTLATVNGNVGTFGSSTAIPSFTVNGKGLITAASTAAVIAPAGTLTGATLASGIVNSSLTNLGTLTGLTTSGLFLAATSEGMRVANDGGYLSFYNTAGSSRTGYLQGNTGTSMVLAAENGAQMLLSVGGSTRMAINTSGVISDQNGYELGYKDIPQNSQSGAYTLQLSDRGKSVVLNGTGGATVPNGVFSGGNAVTLVNNSASAQTITQGTSATLRMAGSTSTGNRTLQPWGIATVYAVTSSVFIISGNVS